MYRTDAAEYVIVYIVRSVIHLYAVCSLAGNIYTKNAAELQEDFIQKMFGCSRIPLSADDQKETFNALLSDTLGEDCDYDVIKNIHETLNTRLEEFKDEPEPLELGTS